MEWKIPRLDEQQVKEYVEKLNVSIPMASILLDLNIELDTAKKLLNDPTDLFDISASIFGLEDVAKNLLKQEGRKIKIFADYDVDGITSGFILNNYLEILGYDTTVYYPSREDGYGLNIEWCREITSQNDPTQLTVITVDNGITANEPISYLRDLGTQVYIIDHHEPIDKYRLPHANAICDAWVDEEYGTHLCAAAVVWKLVIRMAILRKVSAEEINDTMMAYLPYAALATIADVMPPCTENRAIIQEGLRAINNGFSPVLKAMMAAENINTMRTKDIVWTIAPGLNACSRMNEIDLAKKIFDKEGQEKSSSIKELAYKIRDLNRKRKTITDKAIKEILDTHNFTNDPVVFADGSKYPLGVIGILSGKLCEITEKPAIVYQVKDGIGYGSARAPIGIDIKAIVNYEAEKGNAIIALGHAEACGVQINPDKLSEFNKDVASSNLIEVVPSKKEDVRINAVISTNDMTYATMKEINSFGYTSKDIPTLGLLNIKVEPILWATTAGKKHIIFKLGSSSKYAVAWNGYDRYEELGKPDRMNLSGTLDTGAYCRYCKDVSLSEHSTVFTVDKMMDAR